jgi:CubicO group peptidase (beta-lactamase class C family)
MIASHTGFTVARLDNIAAVFTRDVEAGVIPGAVVLVARGGETAFFRAFGYRDRTANAALHTDAIFRGASMTKPLVSVAAMMLAEEGKLQLWEPVATYLPEFGALRVGPEGVAPIRPMTVQDLMRHTSGLTLELLGNTPVHAAYRSAGVINRAQTNAEMVSKLATLPLLYQPGTTFEYGMSTDVLARVVEVVSGMEIDAFLAERICGPLGMRDTAFELPPEKHDRLAEALQWPSAIEPIIYTPAKPQRWYSGGGGILTTAQDYLKFCSMLLGGGALGGTRLLARKTVALMTSDHLPPGCEYGSFTRTLGITAPLPDHGQGFGLGFFVRTHAGRNPNPGSVGDFGWSGLLGTYFWVDPAEGLIAILMLQAPELRVHYRAVLRDLVYAALE